MMVDAALALDGLKVVELPCFDPMPFFAAAMTGKLLADFGAEVIKIEPPGIGAAERRWGPFRGEERNAETNGLHLYLNTNKLGVTVDLGDFAGRVHLYKLLADADVLLNPNLPALNERLELDWRTLTGRFPRLTIISTTFFGAESAYRDRRGGDLVATQMSVVGYGTPMQQVTDLVTQPPLRLAGRQADYVTGYTAAAAALCALLARKDDRAVGMHVDVSQWLAMAQMCRPEISIYSHEAPEAPYRQRLFIRKKTSMQYMFPCKDGWVSFGLATNRHWRGTKRMMGNPEWAESEMFNTLERRLENSDALEALLTEWLSHFTREEVFKLAQAEHVPSFPVNSPAEVANNVHYAERRYFVDCTHPVAGRVRMPGAPICFSRTPWRLRRPAPCLGEHNAEILGQRLGLRPAEIEQIARKTATLVEDSISTSLKPLARSFAGEGKGEGSASISGSERYKTLSEHAGPKAKLPFEGIRITDFGWIYALPYATAWLAALGADVIKIESSTRPDLVRFLSGTDGVTSINRSGIFNAINFSKRSIYLNLTHPKAREIAIRMVGKSDVVTENFTAHTMRNLGLTYDDLHRIRPDLIMLSGTSLGQTGPYANTVGWGPTNQAFAGTSHLTGYPDGFPCAGGGTWPDFAVGVAMVFALTAALYHRSRTGQGQYIDVSMCEVVTSMMPEALLDYFMNGVERGPIGNRDPEMAPHGVFPVKGADRWLAIAIPNDAEFEILCEVLGVPGMARDPRYASSAARLVNADQLEREIAEVTRRFERDELAAMLAERKLCAGAVYDTFDLVNDSAFAQSGMMVNLHHKECGERSTPTLPVHFSRLDPRYKGAPLAGEHTDEILRALLDMSDGEIATLREEKVLI
jgi:crotonobetainyl-CoA:carnitine CoA-transferase CaiB-like acyl-CoA transferase